VPLVIYGLNDVARACQGVGRVQIDFCRKFSSKAGLPVALVTGFFLRVCNFERIDGPWLDRCLRTGIQ
jgi:hypothetical protein